VAGQRTILSGSGGEEEVLRFTATWFCGTDLDPQWDLLATGWRVRVRGDAPLDVAVEFPVPLAEFGAFTPGLTANRPVNAVPYVVAARSGILTTADLPLLTPTGP
jgi:4-hydroxy-tetrahydrodipicolinate reductase